MRNLDKNQKNFLLNHFFKNEKYAGWRNIAEELLKNGTCVVPTISAYLWVGGVGNFIKTTQADGFIECTKLEFDFDSFIKSDCYKLLKEEVLINLNNKLQDLQNQISSIRYISSDF